ncbi:hypothetical protein [Microcoleus sp. F4-D5]|uniref:hypothetical protein n=1 Tax=Microcoleus sp. F4-D5 TaxID=2818760 RepID=UPI002FD19829
MLPIAILGATSLLDRVNCWQLSSCYPEGLAFESAVLSFVQKVREAQLSRRESPVQCIFAQNFTDVRKCQAGAKIYNFPGGNYQEVADDDKNSNQAFSAQP